jgi:hypothetical protein
MLHYKSTLQNVLRFWLTWSKHNFGNSSVSVYRNLSSFAAHLNLSNAWPHTTRCRLTKRAYETILYHTYVSTYKFLSCKNAGVWKRNITCLIKLLMINQCVCVCYEFYLQKYGYCLLPITTSKYTICYKICSTPVQEHCSILMCYFLQLRKTKLTILDLWELNTTCLAGNKLTK